MKARRQHLPADERRLVTVEAVIQLAAEQNPSEITTLAIAQRMGLTQGALFRHFPTKEAVFGAVMEWVATKLLGRIEKLASRHASPLAALEVMFKAHIDFICEHPGVPRMLFGELQRATDTPAKRAARITIGQYGERLAALIERGKAAGEVAPEIDTGTAAMLFIGTIQGLVMQSLLKGNVERIRTEAPGAFAIYLRGIRSPR
jgi:AcrR family transcriptional regulator